jgi:hypothetical protein
LTLAVFLYQKSNNEERTKMRLKNILALALSAALLSGFAACGKSKDTPPITGVPSDVPEGFAESVIGSTGAKTYTSESLRVAGNPNTVIADALRYQ